MKICIIAKQNVQVTKIIVSIRLLSQQFKYKKGKVTIRENWSCIFTSQTDQRACHGYKCAYTAYYAEEANKFICQVTNLLFAFVRHIMTACYIRRQLHSFF